MVLNWFFDSLEIASVTASVMYITVCLSGWSAVNALVVYSSVLDY